MLNVPTSIDQPNLVKVDRTIPLKYPEWKHNIIYPETVHTNTEYLDLSAIGKACKDLAYSKKGTFVYPLLDLYHGLAIQKQGSKVFLKNFGDILVFLYGGLIDDQNGVLHSPYLYMNGEVLIGWTIFLP